MGLLKLEEMIETRNVIVYFTNEHSNPPGAVDLIITAEELETIELASGLVREHGFFSVSIEAQNYEIPVLEDDGEVNEPSWTPGVALYKVYEDFIVFYAENKHDFTDQVEGEKISIEYLKFILK